jgi:hypothetical protein
MVNFGDISIVKEQSTPFAFALLLSQEYAQCPTKHVMVTESLTPIQEVAIIGASSSLHFDVSLDMCAGMIPQF